MKFAVVWKPGAEQDLAAIWLASPDRKAIGTAVTEIDKALQASPMHFGESRESGTRRIGFQAPLGVQYEVLPDSRRVDVLAVWDTSPRKK
jgi:plasmid stabilization system protein ParE